MKLPRTPPVPNPQTVYVRRDPLDYADLPRQLPMESPLVDLLWIAAEWAVGMGMLAMATIVMYAGVHWCRMAITWTDALVCTSAVQVSLVVGNRIVNDLRKRK